MSSTSCRCYEGTACPSAASGAGDFFRSIEPGHLSSAVSDAVADYVHLRGLNGLCPDVKKWSPPPRPAAYLDAGLPKLGGDASVPRGLLVTCPFGASTSKKGDSSCRDSRSNKSGGSAYKKIDCSGRGSSRNNSEGGMWSGGGGHKRSNSIPPPTWESKGPEGIVRQVLSFDNDDDDEDDAVVVREGAAGGAGVSGAGIGGVLFIDNNTRQQFDTTGGRELLGSQSSPELRIRGEGAVNSTGELVGGLPSVGAKQLLRSLRLERAASRQRHNASRRGRGGGGGGGGGGGSWSSLHSSGSDSRPFSPPDDWDDTGIFTVALRPKTVPSGSAGRRHHRHNHQHHLHQQQQQPKQQQQQQQQYQQHQHQQPAFKYPSIGRPVTSVGEMRSGRDKRGESGGTASDGFDLWNKRRRKFGGGTGDDAVEFLDIREAALVSVAEAFARRALPWQAQLCPRALQDMEVARVRVFHAAEGSRQASCKARQEALMRGLLLRQERSRELFAREQGGLFEGALDEISEIAKRSEGAHALELSTRVDEKRARLQREEALDRYNIDRFEESEADHAWSYRQSVLVDSLWDPATCAGSKQAEEERAKAALSRWAQSSDRTRARFDALVSLETTGSRALCSEENARWESSAAQIAEDDGRRAMEDRSEESRQTRERYLSILQTVWEADKSEREVSGELWNLQGWLSVGSHKLVQQTLRAFVRRCNHPRAATGLLWEARNAAEFAGAARAAAATQRAAEARGICNIRREHKIVVRKHKLELLHAEEKRAAVEDAERSRAFDQAVKELKASISCRRGEVNAQLRRERESMLAARREETDRCTLFRREIAALANELDVETERLASAVREMRLKEEELSKSEVSTAVSSLKEEEARAYDREALLGETMLTERDKEDSCLEAWIQQQERDGAAAFTQDIAEARTRLREDRERWIDDVNGSASEMSHLDAALLLSPLAWSTAPSPPTQSPEDDPHTTPTLDSPPLEQHNSGEAIWAGVHARDTAFQLKQQVSLAGKDPQPQVVQQLSAAAETESCAAQKRKERVESLAVLAHEGLEAHWKAFFCDEVERTRVAAGVDELAAKRWAGRQRDVADRLFAVWRSREWKHGAAVAMTEADIADGVVGHVPREGGSGGAATNEKTENVKGNTGVHQKEKEKETLVAEEIDPAVVAGDDAGGAGSLLPASGEVSPDGPSSVAPTTASVIGAVEGDSTQIINVSDVRSDTSPKAGAMAVGESGLVLCITDGNMVSGGGEELSTQLVVAPATAGCTGTEEIGHAGTFPGTFPDGGHMPQSEATAGTQDLVVFVGGTMALHLSTIRPCYMENFGMVEHRRCSIFTADGRKSVTRFPDDNGDGDDGEGDTDQGNEEEWLNVLQTIVEEKEVIDLAELGKILGELPGGATVLCLAHDCLVEDAGELEGFVKSEILHSATAALVALRRGIRDQTRFVTAADYACPDGDVQKASLSGAGGGMQATCLSGRGGGDQATPLSGVGRVQATRLSATGEGNGSVGTMLHSTIANMETRAELDVFGDEVCADLSRIFTSPSAGGDATTGASSQTSCVRTALQKHEALLSPQSACALTALLSARGLQSLANASHRKENAGSCRNASLSSGNPADWKPLLTDALLAVRTASLEHAGLWAIACDPEKVAAACNTHALSVAAEEASAVCNTHASSVAAEEASEVCNKHASSVAAGAGAAPPVCGIVGVNCDTEPTWAALHKASGLGLSPLMLLTATLCPCDASRSVGSDGADGGGQVCTSGGTHGGNASRGGGGGVVCSTSSVVPSALRLLSSECLENLCCHLSQFQTEDIPQKGNVGAESDTPKGNVGTESDSDSYLPDGGKVGSPGTLSNFPGYPAVADISRLDSETLKNGALGVVKLLDARDTGALPPAALVAALQCGEAGLCLGSRQAELVLQLAGCLGAHGCRPNTAVIKEDAYGYLGYPAGTLPVSYGCLVDRLPRLLSLLQAARRVGQASATNLTSRSRSMSRDALERARANRLRLVVENSASSFATALDAVYMRMAYGRLERRSSTLEARRLEAMRLLSARAHQNASTAAKSRASENSRRTELRDKFTAANLERALCASAGGSLMMATAAARVSATTELWDAGGRAVAQAREILTTAVKEMGKMLTEAEEQLKNDEHRMGAEDDKAREMCDQEPEWWGRGLTSEVEASYAEEASWGQGKAKSLLEEASALSGDMMTVWEDDARKCKEDLLETEKRLDAVVAEFEERQSASRNAIEASHVGVTSSTSDQADFAALVQTRHRAISHCREVLAWLGVATNDMQEECSELCLRCADLPSRMEKRLSVVLKTAAATAAQERSTVVRRLHSVSKSWGEEIPRRRRRWGELRDSRRASHEHTRAALEAERDSSGPLGPTSSTTRAATLAKIQQAAELAVKEFLETSGVGPAAVELNNATTAAATAVLDAQEAVKSCVVEAGAGMGEVADDDRAAAGAAAGAAEAGTVAGEGVEIEREDAAARVSACREAVGGWWTRQKAATKEGLRDREAEAEERRAQRAVQRLSSSLIAEIEARTEADTFSDKALGLVLAEARRVAQQFVDAERLATRDSADAAANTRKAVAQESEVLSLESQALSARVSSTLQRGLHAATEDLAAAQRKEKKVFPGSRGVFPAGSGAVVAGSDGVVGGSSGVVAAGSRSSSGVVGGSTEVVPGSGGDVGALEQEVGAGGVEPGKGAVGGSLRVGQDGERAPTPGKRPESPSKARVHFAPGHHTGSPGG